VAAAAAGDKWETLLARRLFGPLGMKSASGTSQQALTTADRACGHWSDGLGRLVALTEWYPLTEPEPAGSVVCSVRDLGPWLRLHLGRGKFAGRQLIAASALAETHSPQMPIRLEGPEADLHPESTRLSYGMGWVVQDYRGLKLVSHAGIIEGFRSHLTLVPRARLGIAILANRHGTRMNLALSNALVDRLLGLKARDWNQYLQEQVSKQAQAEARRWQKFVDSRHVNTKPSLGLGAYAGIYRHPAYGDVKVVLRQGELTLEWRWLSERLIHFHFDVFVFTDEFLGPMTAQFHLDRLGRVSSLNLGPPLGVTFKR
jgi:CubicO group peptidase (beta-lactamase class C family)